MFKFNLLNHHKDREFVKKPNKELHRGLNNIKAVANEQMADKNSQGSNLNFNDILKDLREAMSIQKELGSRLSPEDMIRITGMNPEDLHNFLSSQEMDIKAKGADLISEIESALTFLDKDNADKSTITVMRRLASNSKVKALLITLMLLAKFAPQVQGAEHHDSKKNKIELNKDNYFNHELDSENTYSLSADYFSDKSGFYYQGADAKHPEISLKESRYLVAFNLIDYFATDKAKILDAPAIKADFESFLDRITPDNAEEIIASNFIFFGSSDERPTTNWEGNNENLTEARLNSLDSLLSQTLKNHKFKNLSDEIVRRIKAKTFIHDMPISTTGPEKGVTYITDLDNPVTGKKYTKAEVNDIKQNNPNKYKQLLNNCRRVDFFVSLPKIDHLDPIKTKIGARVIESGLDSTLAGTPKITNLAQYKNITLLFDNSPSVNNSYGYMANMIESQDLKDSKINFATFSKNLDKTQQFDNSTAVAEQIRYMEYNGNPHERALDAISEALKKTPAGEKGDNNIILAMTDETPQDISWNKIQEVRLLADKSNSEVYFYYADDKNKTLRQISLDDLEKAYINQILQRLEKRVNILHKMSDHRITFLESQKENKTALLKRLTKLTQDASTQENISSIKKRLVDIEAEITQEKERLAPLLAAWNKGDLKTLFAQQKNFDLRINGNTFNKKMTLNIKADKLGFVAADLAH